MDEIRDLDKLREDSLITEDEYDRQRTLIMERRETSDLSAGQGDVGVSGWLRFGTALVENLLILVTLGIGWIIWAFTLSGSGQTPAKKLLNQTVIDLDTGKPMKLGRMFWMRGFVGGFVANIAFFFTVGILSLMPFWDKRNQNIYDKISNSLVIETPKSVL
jgi:uncharacterized RDD family membrane protein YckC